MALGAVSQFSLTDLTVAVVHYHTPRLLEECLRRLERFAQGAQVLVLDCGSQESEREWLAGKFRVCWLPVANTGYAATVNVALARCRTPVFAHLNADVLVRAETFPKLLEALGQADVGMVGPRCRTPEGRWQAQGPAYRLNYLRLAKLGARSVPVSWLSGCFQVIRYAVAQELGGMDSSLRFYNEDMEWSWRFRRAGYSCCLVKTNVLHIGGSATPAATAFLVEGYRGGYLLSQRYRSTPYQLLHREAVRLEASWQSRFAKAPYKRQAYARILRMFNTGRFEQSPFGETLEDINDKGANLDCVAESPGEEN